jgi:uncharacterized protein (DUF2267 family)
MPDKSSVGYKYRDLEEFYGLIQKELEKQGVSPNEDTVRTADLTKTVLHYLKNMFTGGEVDDIGKQLPGEIEEVWRKA